jgi:hypothetical protein
LSRPTPEHRQWSAWVVGVDPLVPLLPLDWDDRCLLMIYEPFCHDRDGQLMIITFNIMTSFCLD